MKLKNQNKNLKRTAIFPGSAQDNFMTVALCIALRTLSATRIDKNRNE